MKEKQTKILFGIGFKLMSLIGLLLIASIASLVWLSTRLFVDDNIALIQQMNANAAASLSEQVSLQFKVLAEKMHSLGVMLLEKSSGNKKAANLSIELSQLEDRFSALLLIENGVSSTFRLKAILPSPALKSEGDQKVTNILETLKKDAAFSPKLISRGESQVSVFTLSDDTPVVAFGIPFMEIPGKIGKFSYCLISVFPHQVLQEIFSRNDLQTSYLVDHSGIVIAHPDASLPLQKHSLQYLDIIQMLLSGKHHNGQTRFIDTTTQTAKLGAFHSIGIGGLNVVVEVPEAKAFEAPRRMEFRALCLGIAILGIALLFGHHFANSITWPIYELVGSATKIAQGDFEVNLKDKSKDEIGFLSLTFNRMAKGLKERDQFKSVFSRFHNREVAEKLLSGEVALGGENREVTVLFCDIRNFTQLSENLQPNKAVDLLNEFLNEMVGVITRYGGIVDKYIGDSIMATWGVPFRHPDETYSAVHATLEMRQRLRELNERRTSRGDSELRMGIGINCGLVTAGNIGTKERMEYTVIGDTVNLASRLQTISKQFLTDILITRNVVNKVPNHFLVEQCASVKVRGKSQTIDIFKVFGYVTQKGDSIHIPPPDYSTLSEDPSQNPSKVA